MKFIEFLFIPLAVIYIIFISLNIKKKLSLSNSFVSIFCISTLPIYIFSCILGLIVLFFKGALGIITDVIIILPLSAILLFVFLKINIFPTDKISPKPEKFSPSERKIIGARRLIICGLIGFAIYIVPFTYSLQYLFDSLLKNWMIFANPYYLILALIFYFPIAIFLIFITIGIPTIAFSITSTALLIVYIALLNGCIRNSIILGKNKRQKALFIILSLCAGINIILAIWFIIKSNKVLKTAKQVASKESQVVLSK